MNLSSHSLALLLTSKPEQPRGRRRKPSQDLVND